jgi:predicted transposase/invertase (TIGR01784 family)
MYRVNPRVDFAFKKLFGSEENKDLLISLINAIVSEADQVADIELKNPYNLADYRAGKMSVLDIKAQSVKGRWYNVEMQISEDLRTLNPLRRDYFRMHA